MMFELPTRLVVAYGLITLMVLAAVAVAVWTFRNSQPRRDLRARARQTEHYRKRDQAAAEQAASKR
jgi:hypothetical protein